MNYGQTFYMLLKIKKEKHNENISDKRWSRGLPAICAGWNKSTLK